jgi:hypothetical protein
MTYADRTVVRRSLRVPMLDEGASADRKTVATVGIADLEDRTGHGLTFGNKQFE